MLNLSLYWDPPYLRFGKQVFVQSARCLRVGGMNARAWLNSREHERHGTCHFATYGYDNIDEQRFSNGNGLLLPILFKEGSRIVNNESSPHS